ncbi:homoserine kinase [Endozoicomonas sp. (ex Bugula neritina AB1)]|nr:homoserine kinase [Endozoicomonas sp. (ex Bugula neritina AB1)]
MSVYTHLHEQDINQLLEQYDIGELVSFTGIDGGVENTNYFIDVINEGINTRYVLTLFEYLPVQALPFFIHLTDELTVGGIPAPASIRDRTGQALHSLKGKPAIIAPCLPGQHIKHLSDTHCQQMGTMLAQIHNIGKSSKLQQENQRGVQWLAQQQQRLQPLLDKKDSELMDSQWQSIIKSLAKFNNLPEGLIHGDLFHDNVLFDDNRITGVIDFYNACHDWLIYDVAVTVNDWCLNKDLTLNPLLCRAFLDAYSLVRPFTPEEKQAWPVMLRLASFRFWVSRIITFIHPEEAVDRAHESSLKRNFKDPDEFRDILINRMERIQPAP